MIVVDTNILAYLLLPTSRQAEAHTLGLIDPNWAAPLLWRSEFRNVTAGYMRQGQLSQAEAELATARAASCLLGGEYAVRDITVYQLVHQSTCTAYDCEFAALAQDLGVELITEDRALLKAFPKMCTSLAAAVAGSKP